MLQYYPKKDLICIFGFLNLILLLSYPFSIRERILPMTIFILRVVWNVLILAVNIGILCNVMTDTVTVFMEGKECYTLLVLFSNWIKANACLKTTKECRVLT